MNAGLQIVPDMMGSLAYQGDLPFESALDTAGRRRRPAVREGWLGGI